MLDAISRLYEGIIGFENPDILADLENDYLTRMVYNGRSVLWYLDEVHNVAIYEDTMIFLTEEELENLC